MYTNKAAMQLQLNFLYSQMQTQDASYVSQGQLGWFAFPSVPGGTVTSTTRPTTSGSTR